MARLQRSDGPGNPGGPLDRRIAKSIGWLGSRYSESPVLWQALATRSGGEAVDPGAYRTTARQPSSMSDKVCSIEYRGSQPVSARSFAAEATSKR